METPHSMLLRLVQTGEVVYTVRCGGSRLAAVAMIYGAKEGVNMPYREGDTHPERVSLPESCFYSQPRAKAPHPALRQAVLMRHLFWILQRRIVIRVAAALRTLQ